MAFTGNEDHTIPLEEAAEMNKRFRENFPNQSKGIFFSQATLNEILEQTSAVGIRFYFAMDSNNDLRLTFCGAKANEDDILDIIGDGGNICPPDCSTNNPLNSDSK